MEQISIYEILGYTDDPVFKRLKKMKVNEIMELNEFVIERTQNDWFEIKNNEIHELCSSLENCYKTIQNLICPIIKGFYFYS